MGKKIAWVTDTAALLDEAFMKKYNVHMLPLHIVFGTESLRETIDITQQQLYDRLRNDKMHPTTAQPSMGEMVELYERLKDEGYDCAIAIHVSKELSGAYQSAFCAAEQADFKVYPVDSKIGSYPMMKMIEMGFAMAEQGEEPEQIVEAIEALAERSELSFIPSNLQQLHKSGRVSGTAAFLSHLLNIKVVISFADGKVVMMEKVRADKRAKAYVQKLLQQDSEQLAIKEAAVLHCNNEEGAKAWREQLQQLFPQVNFLLLPLSACVGVHAGEGTTGLTWIR